MRTQFLFFGVLLAGLAPGGVVHGQRADGAELVTVRLLGEHDAWLPGQTQELALAFTIAPGWHLYWKGRNDSGLPIEVEFVLPDGFRAGELRWPAPVRKRSPGDLLDHVLEDEAVLLVPIHVPAYASPGARLSVTARPSWLVCDEACLMGNAEVSLELPVQQTSQTPVQTNGDHERDGQDAALLDTALFATARARLPGPLPDDVQAGWLDGRFVIKVPGAEALAFLPEATGLPLADLLATGATRGDRLQLTPDPHLPGGDRIVGVLRIERPHTPPTHHVLDRPGPNAVEVPTGETNP